MRLRIDFEKIRKFQFVDTVTYLLSTAQTMYSPILFRLILVYLSAIIKTVLQNKEYNIRMPLYVFADGPTKTLYKVYCSSIGRSETTGLLVKWKNIVVEIRGGIVFSFRDIR